MILDMSLFKVSYCFDSSEVDAVVVMTLTKCFVKPAVLFVDFAISVLRYRYLCSVSYLHVYENT